MRTALNPATRRLPKTRTPNPALDIRPEFLPDLSAVTDSEVVCAFEDGRSVSFPLNWSEKLAKASVGQRQAFEFNAHFIFWDDIDEIIGVRNILLGNKLQWS